MKHLKKYKIFESLRDDFKSDLKRVESNYKLELDKIKNKIKEEVDDYMFDILDEYQTNKDSYINVGTLDGVFEIGYDNIEFNLSKSEEFLKIIQESLERIKSQLGLNFKFSGYVLYSGLDKDFHFTSGDIVDFKQLKRDLKSIEEDENGSTEEISKYTIKLTIFVQ